MLQSLLSKNGGSPAVSAVAGLVAAAVIVTIYRAASSNATKTDSIKTTKKGKLPYLESSVPLIGNMLDLMINAPRLHEWLATKLVPRDGHPIVLRLPGKPDMMFLSRPDHFEEILKAQLGNFPKGKAVHEVFFELLGDSIITTNDDTWKRQRQVFIGLFGARALREHMTPLSQKYADVLVEVLADAAATDKTVDFFHLIHRYTMDVFAEIGFGTEMGLLRAGDDHVEPLEEALEVAQYWSANRVKEPTALWKIKRWLNIGTERELSEAMKVINTHVMGLVSDAFEKKRLDEQITAQEKANKPVNKDIISIILNRMQSDKDPMEPAMVRDIAVAAVVAGRDTTADSLGWLFHVLAQNPRVESKLRAELLAKIPKLATDDRYMPSADDINSVTYVEATIREVLRLFPAGPLMFTYCGRDTVFPDGTFVPEGTDIGLAFYTTGRLTSVWGPDAEIFLPERFLDEETGKLLPMAATKFCAFSHGPRACAGQTLAMLEMKIVVASVVSRFRLVPDANQKEVVGSQGLTLGMVHPLLMRIERVAA